MSAGGAGRPQRAAGWLLLALLAPLGPNLALPARAALPVLPAEEELPPSAPEAEAPIVAEIEVRSDAPLDGGDDRNFDALLDIAVGEPLTSLKVRRTLRNLQASGRGTAVEIYTRPAAAGSGVVAVVVVRAAVQVDSVNVAATSGQLGLRREDLYDVLTQRVAQPLSEEQVVAGVYKLQQLYEERGYFDAKVRVQVAVDPATQRAAITYNVDSGPQWVVSAIDFSGPLAPFAAQDLRRPLAIQVGAGYTRSAAEGSVERLQRWLISQSHNLAQVKPPQVDREPGSRVRLTYPVEIGPRLEVQVKGADLDKLKKNGLLPFLGPEGYDEALVQQARGKITDFYQRDGYYHVLVDSVKTEASGVLVLTITVQPGSPYVLTSVNFAGNQGISDRELQEHVELSAKKLLALGSGRLVESVLIQDLDNLRAYYASQGYIQAKIGPPQVAEQGDRLRLTVPIVEGPRQQVGEMKFEGIDALKLDDLQAELPLRAGGPFHPALLDQTLDAVRSAYADRGFDEAQVSATTAWNPAHTRVDLTVSVVEGPQAKVDRILVRGNQHTHSDVIVRTVGLTRGQPVSRTRLLEAERSLYRLGIFSRVNVDLTRAGLGVSGRDVVIRVEEGKSKTLTYGLGYATDEGVRATIGYTYGNVAGRAYSLSTDLRFSQRQDRIARVLFDQPTFFRFPVPVTSSLFYIVSEDVNRGFVVTKYGARTQATKVLGPWHYSLGFDYRVDKVKLGKGVGLNNLERRDRPYHIASVIPSLLLDRRDDPIVPTRGWSSLLQPQLSLPVLGSEAKFLKVFFQQTELVNLGRPGGLAGSLRLGAIEPFRTLPTPDPVVAGLPSSNVFVDERFFAGGSTTHRAYALDLLGIPGRTLFTVPGQRDYSPVGGNGLLLLNLDYRFPIAGAFGGTLFFDTGNVWADWRDINFKDLKPGIGVGARYVSPIGPLRIDLGWKLRRERRESATPVISFSFGNPF
ncbi:MAG TPA: outer membrane protein assembly factor BamA [Thermoanaerobaculia bacterium]|nr:outer membrane protein assembly factor BamA [Thermoanaerobaculia bacterium]